MGTCSRAKAAWTIIPPPPGAEYRVYRSVIGDAFYSLSRQAREGRLSSLVLEFNPEVLLDVVVDQFVVAPDALFLIRQVNAFETT